MAGVLRVCEGVEFVVFQRQGTHFRILATSGDKADQWDQGRTHRHVSSCDQLLKSRSQVGGKSTRFSLYYAYFITWKYIINTFLNVSNIY